MISDQCFKKGGGVRRNNYLTAAEVERTVYCAVLVQVHRFFRGVALWQKYNSVANQPPSTFWRLVARG